eukprot:551020-Prymnesium_polylepis.2
MRAEARLMRVCDLCSSLVVVCALCVLVSCECVNRDACVCVPTSIFDESNVRHHGGAPTLCSDIAQNGKPNARRAPTSRPDSRPIDLATPTRAGGAGGGRATARSTHTRCT